MIRLIIISLVIIFGAQTTGFAQDSLELSVSFDEELLTLNKPYVLEQDTVVFEVFKCYITQISSMVNQDKQSLLLDAEIASSYKLQLDTSNKNKTIELMLGVDSLTNVSGAFSGALDPTNGMYWTWQSGYINIKIEGHSLRTNKPFVYHLGGYQGQFSSAQKLRFNYTNITDARLILDLKPFLSFCKKENIVKVMRPCNQAVILSDKLVKSFTLNIQ